MVLNWKKCSIICSWIVAYLWEKLDNLRTYIKYQTSKWRPPPLTLQSIALYAASLPLFQLAVCMIFASFMGLNCATGIEMIGWVGCSGRGSEAVIDGVMRVPGEGRVQGVVSTSGLLSWDSLLRRNRCAAGRAAEAKADVGVLWWPTRSVLVRLWKDLMEWSAGLIVCNMCAFLVSVKEIWRVWILGEVDEVLSVLVNSGS